MQLSALNATTCSVTQSEQGWQAQLDDRELPQEERIVTVAARKVFTI